MTKFQNVAPVFQEGGKIIAQRVVGQQERLVVVENSLGYAARLYLPGSSLPYVGVGSSPVSALRSLKGVEVGGQPVAEIEARSAMITDLQAELSGLRSV